MAAPRAPWRRNPVNAGPWSVPAAAAARRSRVVARVERVTARAGADRVRVVDREAGPHQAVHVVDLGAPDVGCAEIVDQDADTILLHDLVPGPFVVVERHPVLQARAAAPADEDA